MKEIALIIHEDATLSTVTGAMDMLIHINNLFEHTGKSLPFKIILTGEKPTNDLLTVSSTFVTYRSFEELKHPDLIIVPAFYGERTATLEKHQSIISWIGKMYQQGAEVASLCSGIYFLAEAGLLAGRSCTAHWSDMEDIT